MKKLQSKIAPVFILVVASSGLLVPGQSLGGTVVVSTVPDGANFNVDGQNYDHAMSAVWPPGSKHNLAVTSGQQDGGGTKTRYAFKSWQNSNGVIPGGSYVTVSADPSISSYKATFDLQYALDVIFFSCSDPSNCQSPGIIYVNLLHGGIHIAADGVAESGLGVCRLGRRLRPDHRGSK
jgi:hypothetical protein